MAVYICFCVYRGRGGESRERIHFGSGLLENTAKGVSADMEIVATDELRIGAATGVYM